MWHTSRPTSRVLYYEHIWILSHFKFSLWWLWQPFCKMPTAVTVIVHIYFTGEEFRLTVKNYLLYL